VKTHLQNILFVTSAGFSEVKLIYSKRNKYGYMKMSLRGR